MYKEKQTNRRKTPSKHTNASHKQQKHLKTVHTSQKNETAKEEHMHSLRGNIVYVEQ